ncbi:hypothetical protein D9619_011370 [Psilocybe cf. subviscida]|uniref:Uncharacterized protein n=1 Tax=Psilocybe cf. subviscida TaxID=2480587 RepID=A0A8H5BJF3_9AGAR|nr:hypothetical protein D9619_011370 [Psilocybe cf. subviscida]
MSKPTPHVGIGTMCWHSGGVGYEREGGLGYAICDIGPVATSVVKNGLFMDLEPFIAEMTDIFSFE